MQSVYRNSWPGRTAVAGCVFLLAAGLSGCFSSSDSSNGNGADNGPDMPELDDAVVLPLVFVHGGAGSASQYQTQAMRFASNGYPEDYVYAFEYPGVAPHSASDLDDFIDDALAETGAEQVYLVAHSMGTVVGAPVIGYLSDPARASKVAKYIGIDGMTSDDCPGGVPCMGIFDNDDEGSVLGDNNLLLPHQDHVEVATSAESFAGQFEFLTGVEPARTHILPQEGVITVSGRAVLFPQNTGADGATLEIWVVDSETGARTDEEPLAVFEIGADGDWGPVELESGAHYEKVLLRDDRADHHFYRQPLLRNTHLLRLNTSPADSAILENTNAGPDHAALVVSRDMEWRGAVGEGENDVLEITTVSPRWGDQGPVNAIVEGVGNGNIALHLHDAESTPAISTLELLPYFPDQAFQSGVDVYMPATSPPDGVISLVSRPRGDSDREQAINVPNWASSDHRISVIFNDWLPD